jgi:hypothetical protein
VSRARVYTKQHFILKTINIEEEEEEEEEEEARKSIYKRT